eukprot:CAMPEP_0173242520 /NCGR_PEP_ID=MMETSP1142-20121109/14989_1 /TAXON_ID=483371 /ORGANISM="non described non described, Strain CCMP2298" /LENGTH=78 /DNA_ID=CAMNT_0014174005 /DNA_START=319 /DNA_END=552 /DNA_ORIENTATION=-
MRGGVLDAVEFHASGGQFHTAQLDEGIDALCVDVDIQHRGGVPAHPAGALNDICKEEHQIGLGDAGGDASCVDTAGLP